MKNGASPEIGGMFSTTITAAISELKKSLQQNYEQAYPSLGEIIRLVLDREEANAWELSSFPHLFLPDLVEARIARLGLQPEHTGTPKVSVPSNILKIEEHVPRLVYGCAA
jgi:hypothetical protein